MRFMIMHKNDANTEAGQPPPMDLVHNMGAFIGEYAKAGRFIDGAGLGASKTRTRLVFRNGQCTDWAEQKRPDIVERATVRLWADHDMGRPDPGISWNGGAWDDMARAARLPVGTAPRAGAVVTFDPGTMGAGAETGHIAYVQSVDSGDGTFTVSEMNAPLPWQVTYRTIPIDAIAEGGISFVY